MSSDQKEISPPSYPNANPSTAPPPQYSGTDASSTYPIDQKAPLNTLPPKMHLYYDKGLLSENQEMYIIIYPDPTRPTAKARLYQASFFSKSVETYSMQIYKCESEEQKRGKGQIKGRQVAEVFFPGSKEKGKDKEIKILFYLGLEGETMLVSNVGMEDFEGHGETEEQSTSTSKGKSKKKEPLLNKVPIAFGGRSYHWAGVAPDKYPSSTKGKGKVGDVELIDEEGNVVAVFLNEWRGKGVEEHRAGVLEWKEGWNGDEAEVDRVVATLFGLVDRYQFLSRAMMKKYGEGATGSALLVALCVVS